MKAIPIIALTLISLFLLGATVAADTIQVQNVQINSIGATMPVNIVLDTSMAGVAGYNITVSLSNSSVATITNISFPSWAILNESTTFPASSVRLRTVDLYEQVNPGATSVPFSTITLRGDKTGSTDVVVTINNITSDNSNSVTPAVQSGKFTVGSGSSQPIIINHTKIRLSQIPLTAITTAKSNLYIAYWHTSHGSQITTGMSGLTGFAAAPYGGSTYTFNSGGTNGALDFREPASTDLGNTGWATVTRDYLNAHPEINVVIWSWCGQVQTSTPADIISYLTQMNQLEADYPNVKFVYMTGHLDGTGAQGNLNLRNEQIRNYARANNKILYDFADIESFDPEGLVNYMALNATDNCDYVLNHVSHNWATEWEASHTINVDWYDCSAAHSQALNGNQKAYAAWWLWARLAGWDGVPVESTVLDQIGVYKSGTWLLDDNGDGVYNPGVDKGYVFGGTGWTPVVGDWNHDGKTKVGVYKDNIWLLDYDGDGVYNPGVDKGYVFGGTGWTPVVGDWNHDGKTKVGVYKDNIWLLDYDGDGVYNPGVDKGYVFGGTGWTPVVGDWNHDGKTKVGVYKDNIWLLDYDGDGVYNPGVDKGYVFGGTGWTPVVGDWNHDGKTKVGVYKDNIWLLDYDGDGVYNPGVDKGYVFGLTGWTPVVGDWNHDGKTKVGVYKDNIWLLDYDGDGVYNPGVDKGYVFGLTGWTSIVGKW